MGLSYRGSPIFVNKYKSLDTNWIIHYLELVIGYDIF
jgi:hypothetical protein